MRREGLSRRPKFWVVALGAILAAGLWVIFPESITLNDAILGYTALVVILYMLETAAMREEAVRQTELQLRPHIVGEAVNGELVLINIGHGTAVNVEALPAVPKDPVLENAIRIRVYPPQIMLPRERHYLETREPFSVEDGKPISKELFAHYLSPRLAAGTTELTIHYDRADSRHRYRSVIVVEPGRVRQAGHFRIDHGRTLPTF